MARTALYPVGGREPETWSSLEASLGAIPEAEAVEICRERILAAHAAGKRAGGTLAYFAQVLADEVLRRRQAPTPEPPRSLPDPGCGEWGRLRAATLERAPDPVRAAAFLDAVAGVTGAMDGGTLVLTAPDPFRRDFLVDRYGEDLALGARALNCAQGVRIEAPAETAAAQAAGGA
jgi:hypothetical protein